MLRVHDPHTAALREWAERIAARRGRKIAVVALARRLAGILFARLRDETVYAPAVSHSHQDQGTESDTGRLPAA